MRDGRPYLSATQVSMFLKCPRQWAFRYVEGLRIPPSGAMKQSHVFHSAAERNYRQKIETGTDLPLDEQQDFYRDTWEAELQAEDVVFDKDKEETPTSMKDQGIEIVKEHHTKIAPLVMPATVEEKIIRPFGKDEFAYDLMGIVDLVDAEGNVRDNKALGKTPSQQDIDRDIQLSTYSLLYRLDRQKPEAGLKMDAIIKTKTPKAVTLETKRTREGLRLHLNMIGHIARAIKAEAFPPNPTGWWCSEKFCGYWSRCMGKGMVTVDIGASVSTEE